MILTGDALQKAVNETFAYPPEELDPISVDVHVSGGLHLRPQSFGTVGTLEDFDVPTYMACLLTGRSSHMRQGIYMPGGWIDPGKRGSVELEFFNMSMKEHYIDRGEPGARLVFFELAEGVDAYDGKWQE